MNFTTVTEATEHGFISKALFSGETKKEQKHAAMINSFYGKIIDATENFSKTKGAKYVIDISASIDGETIKVCLSLRIKVRGRIVYSLSDSRLWNDGIIIKKAPAVNNIQSNNKKQNKSHKKCTKQ